LSKIYPYFPDDYWYNFHTGKVIPKSGNGGSFQKVLSSLSGLVPLFLRGGKMVFL